VYIPKIESGERSARVEAEAANLAAEQTGLLWGFYPSIWVKRCIGWGHSGRDQGWEAASLLAQDDMLLVR